MATGPIGRHAGGGGSPSSEAAIPEPTYAERARTLVHLGRVGSLSTHSKKEPGFPFGSVMPYGLDERGRPIFLISTMAMHTQNVMADQRASLLVTQGGGGDPLGAGRVTLVGNVIPIRLAELDEAKRLYLERYPNSRHWVDYEDFSFYRLEVVDVYFVGGFGVMGWVTAEDYISAQPDPLADFAAEIIEHMNADHADALVLLARAFASLECSEAAMTSVDRLGFQIRAITPEGPKGARIAFPGEVKTLIEARNTLVAMTGQARLNRSNT